MESLKYTQKHGRSRYDEDGFSNTNRGNVCYSVSILGKTQYVSVENRKNRKKLKAYLIARINSKMIKDISVLNEIIKILKEHMGKLKK